MFRRSVETHPDERCGKVEPLAGGLKGRHARREDVCHAFPDAYLDARACHLGLHTEADSIIQKNLLGTDMDHHWR